MKRLYAVKIGRKTGIFYDWRECEKQVKGYKGAIYKGFNGWDAEEKAEAFLYGNMPKWANQKKKSKLKRVDANGKFKYASMKHGKVYRTTYAKNPNTEFYSGDFPPWN